jgi:rRNA biogenesis protein RRP5
VKLKCITSELSDNPEADVKVALRGFRGGDHVKALILKIENRRISLGLKPSYFTEEDFEDDHGAAEQPEVPDHNVSGE